MPAPPLPTPDPGLLIMRSDVEGQAYYTFSGTRNQY